MGQAVEKRAGEARIWVLGTTNSVQLQGRLRVTSGPSAAPPRRSVPGGRADEIRAKAEVTARKSVVGGGADLPRAWLELRLLAKRRPKCGYENVGSRQRKAAPERAKVSRG